MASVPVHISNLLWEKRWQVSVFGKSFPCGLRLVAEGDVRRVEFEAEAHRAALDLIETSATLMMAAEFILLTLVISDLVERDGHLRGVTLELQASAAALRPHTLVRELITFSVLDDRLVPDLLVVREI